jgi:SH3-like domain-containing protein
VNTVVGQTNQFIKQLPPKQVLLYRHPDETSYPFVRAEIGVLGKVLKCQVEWCQLQLAGYKGWIRKVNLWGVYPET